MTKLLSDHVAEEAEVEETIRAELVGLDGRLEHLSVDVGTYLAATEAWSPSDGQLHTKDIKAHLGKVKTLLTMGKEVHEAALQQAREAASRLKDTQSKRLASGDTSKQKVQTVVDQSQTVKEYAAAGSSQSQMFFFLIVVCISVLGFMFLNRMRYYEKKHFI